MVSFSAHLPSSWAEFWTSRASKYKNFKMDSLINSIVLSVSTFIENGESSYSCVFRVFFRLIVELLIHEIPNGCESIVFKLIQLSRLNAPKPRELDTLSSSFYNQIVRSRIFGYCLKRSVPKCMFTANHGT